jgi:NifB/MoaA-like Fe-S oxidoreductase
LAGAPLPGRAHYEGFPQLGNGIGGARRFLDGVRRTKPPNLGGGLTLTLVTGVLARPLVEALAAKVAAARITAAVCSVSNRLFGSSVTVAGLLAGADIARALRGRPRADLVIVPGTAVREGEGFLDGMTLEKLSAMIGAPAVAASTPAEAMAAIRRFDRGRRRA